MGTLSLAVVDEDGDIIPGSYINLSGTADGAARLALSGLLVRLAGERNEESTSGVDHVAVAEEWEATVVDLTVDAGATIWDGPAICGGIWLPAALSAQTVEIADNATTKITLPASLAAGPYNWRPWKAYTNLKVVPNASSTGSMVVFWRPLDDRVVAPA